MTGFSGRTAGSLGSEDPRNRRKSPASVNPDVQIGSGLTVDRQGRIQVDLAYLTANLPFDETFGGGGGTMDDFSIRGDTVDAELIENGEVIYIEGGLYITTTTVVPNTVIIDTDIDLDGLTDVTSPSPGNDNLLSWSGSAWVDVERASLGLLTASGVVGLSADWDAGPHKITAEQFESDVATGTAPLIIASTTPVANLHSNTATRWAEGTSFPGSPIANQKFVRTDLEDTEFTWDSVRSHWFGPMEWADFGTNSTMSDGQIFKSAWGGVQPSNSRRGWIPDYPITVVGMVCRNGTYFTGNYELTYNAAGVGVTVAFSGAEKAADRTLDHDIALVDSMGVKVNITSDTVENPTCRVYYKRRGP